MKKVRPLFLGIAIIAFASQAVLAQVFIPDAELSPEEIVVKKSFTPMQIIKAEVAIISLRDKVAQNLSKIEMACANPTSTVCVHQKRESAQFEGALMGTEAALREIKNNDSEESNEYLQKSADAEQLRNHLDKVCGSPNKLRLCEDTSIQLEKASAWVESYFKHKWPEENQGEKSED